MIRLAHIMDSLSPLIGWALMVALTLWLATLVFYRRLQEARTGEKAQKVASAKSIATMQKRMGLAASTVGLGIWEYDPQKKRLIFDEGMLRLYGLKASQFGGRIEDWLKYVHPEDRERMKADAKVAIKGVENLTSQFRIVLPDGAIRHIYSHATSLREDAGKSGTLIGINYDITREKKNESVLRLERERLQFVLAGGSIGTWEWNYRADRVLCNETWASMLGYELEELAPISFERFKELVHPDDLERVTRQVELCVSGSQAEIELEIRLRHKEGHWVPVLDRGRVSSRDPDGKPRMFFGTHVDLTGIKVADEERLQLQKQLAHSQKMESIGRLAGGIAHDFNNMLQVILAELDDPKSANFKEIKLAAERSAELTRGLLAFARKQAVRPQVVDFNQKVGALFTMLQRLIGENIKLHWHPGEDLEMVRIDPNQIDQILVNLVVNSRDSIRGNGSIHIRTEMVEMVQIDQAESGSSDCQRQIVLTVTDDGCGMDARTQSQIFEPFFTTKAAGEGTGLGLATVYGIVTQNDGFIEVETEVGQGTTFKIHLPTAGGGLDPDTALIPIPKRSSSKGLHLLLAEDEERILRLLEKKLSDLEFQVHAFADPLEAVEAASREATIDFILTDVIMPNMNGHELVHAVREHHPKAKVLYMSGYTADVITKQGILKEGVHFLEKPFSVDQLTKKIDSVLTSPLPD